MSAPEQERESIRIEHHANEGARLNQYMDAMDLGALLILIVFVPIGGKQVFNANAIILAIPGVFYIFWMFFFKINKPRRYFTHWLKFHNRNRLWGSASYAPKTPFTTEDDRGEGSFIQTRIKREH